MAAHLFQFWKRTSLLQRGLLAFLLIIVLLEWWRPCFFLTDDNLSYFFPIFTEIGRHLKSGVPPFHSDYLFGGHYNYLRDPAAYVWHPWIMAVALLADTPLRFLMLDVVLMGNFLLALVGMLQLAAYLRTLLALSLSDNRIIFYALSYTFSTYALTTGASWEQFSFDASVLPWLALGILHAPSRRSLFLVFLFSLHHFMGGYLPSTFYNLLFLSLFAVAVAASRRSLAPLLLWTAGNFAALLIVLPFYYFTWQGFQHSSRAAGLTIEYISANSVPAPIFILSLFGGNFTELISRFNNEPQFYARFLHIPTLVAAAAAWCLVPAFCSRDRWRILDLATLGLAVLLSLLIIRPEWLSAGLAHVPVLNSMRWPFREILQFQFFLHLFLILRPSHWPSRMQNIFLGLSLTAFLLPLPFNQPPSFNPLTADRALLFSGEADLFWRKVSAHLRPGGQIASVIEGPPWDFNENSAPFVLVGTANFPACFKVHSISGYSTTAPLDQLPLKTRSAAWFGSFTAEQVPALLREKPDLTLIRVERMAPLKITLLSPGKPPLDLTPELPPSFR